ncbi:hypothetical protein BDZ85DRAFT_92347 [Elsinoe ampelina]|uniref:Rhodopsin domain-containing protein n=1 Tax=Elsinoe ampelina TaxID=302913 RepID=A0A6A6FYG3_9PEZI|nr:hypothetical protein BDZ85DRAFT_92347 [Elsinoe ampelina]
MSDTTGAVDAAPPEVVGTGNTAPGLTTATVLFFVWGALSLGIRLWVKARDGNTFGKDDTAISLAAFASLAHVVSVCWAIHRGYGGDWTAIESGVQLDILKAFFAGQVTYILSIGLSRMSMSFFSERFLTRTFRTRLLANTLTGLYALWAVVSTLIIALRGPLAEPWLTTDGSSSMYYRWVGVEVVGLAIDIGSVVMSTCMIWGLQMPLRKRLAVAAIFCSRLLIIGLVALRLWKLYPADDTEVVEPPLVGLIFTEAVMNATFILVSVTCLKPFLQPFAPGVFVASAGDAGVSAFSAAMKGSRGGPVHELNSTSSRSRTDKEMMHETVRPGGSGEASEDERVLISQSGTSPRAWRPDQVEHQVEVRPRPADQQYQNHHRTDDRAISMTHGWTVSYDRSK